MDISSPVAPQSSLPPSSALPSTNGRGSPRSNPRSSPRARQVRQPPPADALAFGDDEAEEEQEGDDSGVRRRRRARGQINANVPLVKDAVGESVAESFETFLKGSVSAVDALIAIILTVLTQVHRRSCSGTYSCIRWRSP